MFFRVDPACETPIYEQISRQVRFAIATGTLRTGQRLPSVRQLATELAVNPNTVARAIRTLQEEGIAQPLRGRGMVVCTGAAAKCRQQRRSLVSERIESVLAEALAAGLGAQEIQSIVQRKLRTLEPKVGGRLDGEVEIAHPP